MNHAICPVAADTARHLAAIDRRDQHHAEIDRRSDAIRDEIEAGDWKFVEDCLADGPDAQKAEFYKRCIVVLMARGSEYMTGPLSTLAAPFQEMVALGIDERVRREIARDEALAEEKPWEAV